MNYIPGKINGLLRKLNYLNHFPTLLWSKFSFITDFLSNGPPPQKPPVLLLSLPRSGSTWVGNILGSAPNALYLREPMNQSYLHLVGQGPTVFSMDRCEKKNSYKTFTSNAFNGIPRFNSLIVFYPNQWAYSGRGKKRILIKEVNPLILPWILDQYEPRIIYLVRHPAAVANSYFTKGWAGDQFPNSFSNEELKVMKDTYTLPNENNFWLKSGAFQSVVQKLTLAVLSKQRDCLTVLYEDICRNPMAEFTKLFNFCEFVLTEKIKKKIDGTSNSNSAYIPGEYDLNRDSGRMIDRWKTLVDRKDSDSLRHAYLLNEPVFYREEKDWQ
jgi:hypothetical protein